MRGRRARLDVVTMLESDSLDSDSSSVLLRLFVSLGSVVGVSAVALSCGSKSDLSSTFNIVDCTKLEPPGREEKR